MNKAKRLQRQLDRFIEKLSGVNKPYRALKKLPQYILFKNEFHVAIQKQAIWAAEHVGEIDRHGDIKQHLSRNMPPLTQYIRTGAAESFMKFAFEWGVTAQYQRMGIRLKANKPSFTKADTPPDMPLDANGEPDPTNMSLEQWKTIASAAHGRPQTQVDLENAHNAGDYKKVAEILNAMPDSDPYKATMVGVFKDDLVQAGKDVPNPFTLTNQTYLNRIKDNASYLLNESSIDDTTISQISTIIQNGRNRVTDGQADPMTNDEIAQQISDSIAEISGDRADMIARTEAASAMGDGDMAAMTENNIAQFDWVAAGDNPCPLCEDAEAGSPYYVDDPSVPDLPLHPNCECYRQGDDSTINLDDMSIWDGSDSSASVDDGS